MISWSPVQLPTDYAIIAGKQTPGAKCEIVGASAPRKWDEQKGYALSGAWLIYTGDGLAHFSIRLYLYSHQDWIEWWAFRPIIAKRPKFVFDPDRPIGMVKEALSIWHPFLEPLGITSVVVEEELQPVLNDDTGEWVIEIKLIQFRKPKIQAAKPVASKETTAPPDPVEQEILAKSKIRDDIAQQLAK